MIVEMPDDGLLVHQSLIGMLAIHVGSLEHAHSVVAASITVDALEHAVREHWGDRLDHYGQLPTPRSIAEAIHLELLRGPS